MLRTLVCAGWVGSWMVLSALSAPAQEAAIRVIETPADKPPSDAVVLYDGQGTEAFLGVDGQPCRWPSENGVLTVGKGFIVSKLHFRDAQLHVEFMVPTEAAGNSGVYIHGHYELQISNTAGSTKSDKEMIGSLYRFTPPLVNAGRLAHQWQTYDIVYRAPRYDESGKIREPGSVTALLNGVLVQNNTSFREPRSPYTPYVYRQTPYTARILESLKKTDAGPLYLQDHQSPVKFRSVWIRPLDDCAKLFE